MYYETLKNYVQRTIQNERCGMLTYDLALLHGNALPHTAALTRVLLEHFNWELFDHSTYSPAPFFQLM
jgi:hypothetical protein